MRKPRIDPYILIYRENKDEISNLTSKENNLAPKEMTRQSKLGASGEEFAASLLLWPFIIPKSHWKNSEAASWAIYGFVVGGSIAISAISGSSYLTKYIRDNSYRGKDEIPWFINHCSISF